MSKRKKRSTQRSRQSRHRESVSQNSFSRRSHPLLMVCVLFSGMASLVYEVVWARQLICSPL
jgi:hypothetical protein